MFYRGLALSVDEGVLKKRCCMLGKSLIKQTLKCLMFVPS